jgi:adenylate cyclase
MGKNSQGSWATEIGLTLSLAFVLAVLAAADAGGYFGGLVGLGASAVDSSFEYVPERMLPFYFWPFAEAGAAAISVTVAMVSTRRMSWFTLPFVGIITTAILYGSIIILWRFDGKLVDPLTAAVMSGVIISGITLYRVFERQAHSKTLRAVLGHGVSRQMLRVLTNAGQSLESDGTERNITLLHCDLRDVDALYSAYEKSPEALVQILRMTIDPLMNAIRTSGGTVERTSSTGLKAMWNAPVETSDHEKRACDTAMILLERLDAVNGALEQLASENNLPYTPLTLGIGINTGPASIGNMGTEEEPLFSAVGSTVRLSKHFQDASETYGPAIIVGEKTYGAVDKAFAFMQVDKVRLSPGDGSSRAFALLGNPLTMASPKFKEILDRHAALLSAYEAGNWEQARLHVKACRELETIHPKLYDLYETRINFLRRNPPEGEWDGVFQQKSY